MQRHKKLKARILSLALSVAMVTTMMPATVFAAEGGTAPGASSIGTIQSFDKLGDRFQSSTGEGASKDVYALNVELDTLEEDLRLPDELTAMVARTTTVSAPDEDKVVGEDTDDTVSGNQPASPSDAEEEVKEEIPDEDVPLAPEPDEETTVTTVEQESIPVTWNSDKEYVSDENGQFIYTAELTEGYNLADGVELPQIYILVGEQTRAARAYAITIDVNNGTTAGGATLQAVVEANGGATAVTSLKVTAGKVTTADWNYLNTLSALKTFEINSAVTVDAIPNSSSNIFPSTIETVTVPQAITIGENAFWGCNALTNANFPAATTLGKMAFMGCTALASVNLPKVTSIGDFAFQQCDALTNVSFLAATTLGELVFYDSEALASASFPVLADIGDEAFAVCDELTSLNLGATPPSSVGTGAFDGGASPRALGYLKADGTALTGTDLTNAQAAYKAVAGTDSNTRDNLWYDWTIVSAEATSITVTINGVDYEGDTFQNAISKVPGGATAVTSLKITAGAVTEADWNYLKSLDAMISFEIESGVTVAAMPDTPIGSLFPTSIVSVTVPQEIAIGTRAFSGCYQLTTVNFPAVTTIYAQAFYNCYQLTSVSFPAVTEITKLAFYDSGLTSASFPVLKTIGEGAFGYCTKLTSLKLGATVPTSVATDAFSGGPETRALGYVDASGNALAGEDLAKAIANYTAKADADGKWYGWTIEAAEAASITVTINGVDYEGDTFQNAISKVPGGATAVTSLKVTAGPVTENDWNYLTNLSKLSNFEIADDSAVTSVADIPNSRSANPIFPPSIVSVTVPQEIAIGKRAFNRCSALTSASFPAATTIGDNAFNSCSMLASASFPAAETIGTYAFSGCSMLATLKLGATPPTVGTNAFNGGASSRALGYVDANGDPLAGTALATAITNYKNDTTAGAVEDGKWYGWTIETVAYKAVTSITGVPTSARVGTNLALTGTVTPADANNKDIVWTVKNAGATGARISGNTLSTTAAGTVVVTATIVNGLTASSDFISDFTITVSQSGGGGGGGSSSGGQTIYTSVPPKYTGGTKIIGNVRVPDYTVEGAWKKNANGTWNFSGKDGKAYANSWAPVFNPYAEVTKGQSAFDWFKFDASGNMITGWHTDTDGNTYYLNPNSDNTLGAMKTGWVLINGKYYYFNEMPDGTRGKLFQNTTTPDGYFVDKNGVWDGIKK